MLRLTLLLIFLGLFLCSASSQDVAIAYTKQDSCSDSSFCKLTIKVSYENLNGMLRLKQFWPSGIEVICITKQPEIIFSFGKGISSLLWQNIPKTGSLEATIAYRFKVKTDKALLVHAQAQFISNGKRIEKELSPFGERTQGFSSIRAKAESKNTIKEVQDDEIHFRIQLGSDVDDEQENRFASMFGLLPEHIQVDVLMNSFVYTFGRFSSLEEARTELQKNAKMKGKAFVAGFKGNTRIELEEAIKLTRKTP